MPRAKPGALTAVAFLVVATVLAASCSSSKTTSSESSSALSKDIARQLTATKFLDSASAKCVANHVAPKISEKGKQLAKSVQSVTGLSKADQQVLSDGFDACVSAAQLGTIISAVTPGAAPGSTSPTQTCVAAKLAEQYPTSGAMFHALFGTQGQAAIISMMGSCGVPGLTPPTSG
jgi:uncharacterized protein (UPF0261 family)